jgi:hypothetical protein
VEILCKLFDPTLEMQFVFSVSTGNHIGQNPAVFLSSSCILFVHILFIIKSANIYVYVGVGK